MAAKILLVDDDKDRRDSVRVILKTGGYVVVEATDGENALSVLASETFDVILLDMTLPDKTGFLVLRFLKENHVASKVIVLTGTLAVENAVKRATPGARKYVSKPYDPEHLLKSIGHALSDRSQTNLKLQIIEAGAFIKSTPTGDLDLMASKQGFAQIAASGADLQDYTVLIDLRNVKSLLTTSQIYGLASELVTYGKTFRRKTAVLARDDKDFNQASFFETAAQNRGFRARAFTVFEDALVWLSNITEPTEDQ
jgi:DNA-binding response OmpR family regulator